MPNRVHGIIRIGCQTGAQHADYEQYPLLTRSRALAWVIVRSFKAAIRWRTRIELNWTGVIWQRSYFERVMRVGREYVDTVAYIKENPRNWQTDQENPDSKH
jgi:REP element-mobilizing transposase RayT